MIILHLRYIALILASSFFLSCSGDEKQYTISDIKFPEDDIRAVIERNKICNTYYYYSETKSPNGKPRNSDGQCDSTITESYDARGNMILNIDGEYEYDINNQLVYSNSGRCLSSTSYYHYAINSAERILYKIRTDKKPSESLQQKNDTVFFNFDEDGKITSSKYNNSEEGVTYQYDSTGKLVLMLLPDCKKEYFYSGNRLDSIYFEIEEEGETYANKYFYDAEGLIYKKIEYSDRVPYAPYSMRLLITYKAKHIKCK